MADRWRTKPIIWDGGLDLTIDLLEQGTLYPGSARELINYEPAEERGFRKILGYTKYDSTTVPGDANSPITGVHPYDDGILAVRYDSSGTPTNDVYESSGSGWTKINSSTRGGSVTRVRFHTYSITEPVVVLCDGFNPALKYNGTTDTTLNTAGAPTDPKYVTEHLNRLVLAGYTSNTSAITLSAPNDDTNYNASAGAIEINVGDEVVGLKSLRENLYIFCTNSIHVLLGTSSADFVIRSVIETLGCINGDTIQEVAGDIIYLAPDGFRSLQATEKYGNIDLGLVSKQIQTKVQTTVRSNPTILSSLVVPSKAQYRCFVFTSGLDDASQVGYLAKFKPTERYRFHWADLLGIPAYSAGAEYLDNDNELVVFGHPTDGYVYQLESGGSFDGNAIPHSLKSPPITFDDVELRKVMFRVESVIESEGDSEVNLRLLLDEYHDRNRLQPSAKIINLEGTGAVFGTAIFDTDVFAGESIPSMITNKVEGSGYTITLQYSGNNTDEPHRIDSSTLSYTLKGRR